jgi:hypothetical protein
VRPLNLTHSRWLYPNTQIRQNLRENKV